MNIKIVEEIINAFIFNDTSSVVTTLQKEYDLAKNKKKNRYANILNNLIKKIPRNKFISSQGTTYSNTEQSSNTLYERVESNILLEDIVLNDDAKITISRFISEWENIDKLNKYNISPTNKLLFYGPPGTGKTKLAYGLANKLNIPLILVRLDEVISSYLGKTGKNIREIFDVANKERVIIFLDEIDTLAKHRDDESELGELKRVVTVLLQNIDNFTDQSIIIGATNHEGLLDRAIWRRFPLKIGFSLPNLREIKLMYKLFIDGYKHKYNLELIANLSKGSNGSTIFDICELAKKTAILNGKKSVEDEDFIKSILSTIRNKEPSENNFTKKKLYEICLILVKYGYKIKYISDVSGIPYTTLKDNL